MLCDNNNKNCQSDEFLSRSQTPFGNAFHDALRHSFKEKRTIFLLILICQRFDAERRGRHSQTEFGNEEKTPKAKALDSEKNPKAEALDSEKKP